MNCLVVAATVAEIKPFLDICRSGTKLPATLDIDVLITGIGLTASTYSLTKQVSIKRPDFVVQAGIAGCFDHSISLGTVLAIKKDIPADQGVVEKGELKNIFDLKLASRNQPPFSNGWLINKTELLKKTALKKVTGISVNDITTSAQKQRLYMEKYEPVTESMEGAALHYVCLQERIAFLQLRAVSNYARERNKKNWNFKDSIFNLNKELISLLQQL